jgi:hypothetical protein
MSRLTLKGPDWKFGDVLGLENDPHPYRFMFLYRKPRSYMPDGAPNDRGFVAMQIGTPGCPYPASSKVPPCQHDHSSIGKVHGMLGGLPNEKAWVLVDE